MNTIEKIIGITDHLTNYVNSCRTKMTEPVYVDIMLDCVRSHLVHLKSQAISLKMDWTIDCSSSEDSNGCSEPSKEGKEPSKEDSKENPMRTVLDEILRAGNQDPNNIKSELEILMKELGINKYKLF